MALIVAYDASHLSSYGIHLMVKFFGINWRLRTSRSANSSTGITYTDDRTKREKKNPIELSSERSQFIFFYEIIKFFEAHAFRQHRSGIRLTKQKADLINSHKCALREWCVYMRTIFSRHECLSTCRENESQILKILANELNRILQ